MIKGTNEYLLQQNKLLQQRIDSQDEIINELESTLDELEKELETKDKSLKDSEPLNALTEGLKEAAPIMIAKGFEMLGNLYDKYMSKTEKVDQDKQTQPDPNIPVIPMDKDFNLKTANEG